MARTHVVTNYTFHCLFVQECVLTHLMWMLLVNLNVKLSCLVSISLIEKGQWGAQWFLRGDWLGQICKYAQPTHCFACSPSFWCFWPSKDSEVLCMKCMMCCCNQCHVTPSLKFLSKQCKESDSCIFCESARSLSQEAECLRQDICEIWSTFIYRAGQREEISGSSVTVCDGLEMTVTFLLSLV